MVRFLHTADWQIGMTRRWLSSEAQARFADARIEAIRSLGVLAEREGCEFVLVCGDVFDAPQLSAQTVGRALEAMGEVGLPVYLLPGNHDPDDAFSIYRSPQFLRDRPANVRVLDEPGPVPVRAGLELVAAPWRSKHPGGDLVAEAMATAGRADGTVRIVVGHGAVDVLDPDRDNLATIATAPLVEALEEGRVHYVALGDRHSATEVLPGGGIWYSGTPEVTSPREVDAGFALVVDAQSGDGGPRVVKHRVGTWSFRVIDREITGAADIAALDRELTAVARKDRTVIRLALRGVLGLADHAELTEVCSRHQAVLAGLHAWNRHSDIRVVADPEDVAGLGLTGFVATAAEEIRARAASVQERGPEQDSGHEVEQGQESRLAAERPTRGDGADGPAGSSTGHRDRVGDEAIEHRATTETLTWSLPQHSADDPALAGDALSLLHRLVGEAQR